MNVEIVFGGERRGSPRLPYRFHRLKAGEKSRVTVLSPMPVVITYHWIKDHGPVIHTTPRCVCTDAMLPFRERSYVAVLRDRVATRDGVMDVQEVLEVPELLRAEMDRLAAGRRYIRGLRLELERAKDRANGPVAVLQSRWVEPGEVPPDLDVRGFVAQLWEPFVWRMGGEAAPGPQGPGGVDDDGMIPV